MDKDGQQLHAALQALVQPLQQAVAANQNAGRHTKKVPELSTADPDKWRVWRHNFENIAAINGWDNLQARPEISSSITEDAWNRIKHIPDRDPRSTSRRGTGWASTALQGPTRRHQGLLPA